MTKRRIVPVVAGDAGKCRCGLRCAYRAFVTYEVKNRFGLREPVTAMRAYCTQHAKEYMRKYKLEVQPIETALDDRRAAMRDGEDREM
jgi:hypothetical protein